MCRALLTLIGWQQAVPAAPNTSTSRFALSRLIWNRETAESFRLIFDWSLPCQEFWICLLQFRYSMSKSVKQYMCVECRPLKFVTFLAFLILPKSTGSTISTSERISHLVERNKDNTSSLESFSNRTAIFFTVKRFCFLPWTIACLCYVYKVFSLVHCFYADVKTAS